MSPRAAAAVAALADANIALRRARVTFLEMGDRETAKLLRETIEDNETVMEALVRQQRRAHPVQVVS